MPTNPLYAAAKHALVGLVRSIGPVLHTSENITVNAICPAFVPTNLAPKAILEKWPKEHVTPMSTILKAFDTFLGDGTLTGQTVECSLGELHFRKQIEWANESQRWIGEESGKIWDEGYEGMLPEGVENKGK
jgi:15-hydroxyprostaglandin dehydrogenase (NAD)